MPIGPSIREAARNVGVSHTALRKAVSAQRISLHADGSVDEASLREWCGNRRAPRGGNHRKVSTEVSAEVAAPVASVDEVATVEPAAPSAEIATAALAMIAAPGGIFATRAAAELARDSYVARLRQLELEEKLGRVAPIDDIVRMVGIKLSGVRSRLLAIPSGWAPRLHRAKTVSDLHSELTQAITEALEDLSDPAKVDEAVRGVAGKRGAPATARQADGDADAASGVVPA